MRSTHCLRDGCSACTGGDETQRVTSDLANPDLPQDAQFYFHSWRRPGEPPCYEGGLKGAVMDGRSRFAVAGFFMDYTNLQVQTPVGIAVFDISKCRGRDVLGWVSSC
jgi:hypothetical protein